MNKSLSANNFDLLRIIAAIQVLILHCIMFLNLPHQVWVVNCIKLFPGVPMFFVMSGFLISASYERNSDLKNYFTNRCLRILPGLWTCLFLSVVAISIFGRVSFNNREALPWLLKQMAGLIYTPNF